MASVKNLLCMVLGNIMCCSFRLLGVAISFAAFPINWHDQGHTGKDYIITVEGLNLFFPLAID